MKIKNILCLILAVMILTSICGCGKEGITILPAPYDNQTQYDFALSGNIVKAGEYSLLFNGKLGFPTLHKEGHEKVWDSSIAGSFAASSIFIEVYDPEYESFLTVKSVDAVKEGRVKAEEITTNTYSCI